jgi:hypothetical protein
VSCWQRGATIGFDCHFWLELMGHLAEARQAAANIKPFPCSHVTACVLYDQSDLGVIRRRGKPVHLMQIPEQE